MPREQHRILQREARTNIKTPGKFRSTQERRNAYVYGGMRKKGWKPRVHHPPKGTRLQ